MQTNRYFIILALLGVSACSGSGATIGSPGATTSTTSPVESSGTTPAPSSLPSVAPSATPPGSGATTASSVTVPFPSTSDSDPFYAQPSPFPSADAPGTILASRTVTYAPIGGVPMQNKAYELRFVSRDTSGNPIAAIATVVLPLTPAVGVTPLDVVLYAEDGLGAQCAPSHSVTGSTADSVEQAEASVALQGLAQGWVLLYPDYQGPQSSYGAGRLSGQITLDAIRAAEHFSASGLTNSTPVGLTGYSGGAFPAAWSATLQASYAPELNIVGIASGGTPANPEGIVENIDTNTVSNAAFFALIFSAIEGVNRSYPTLLTPILNAKGVAAAVSLENGCDGAAASGTTAPSGTLADYSTVADPVHASNVEAIYPLITLPLAGHAPVTNVFVYHSQVDELIPIAGADAMVAGWCAAGSAVQYYRGVSGDHIAFEASMAPLVYAYLASRFGGGTTIVPPGSTSCNT